MGSYPGGVSPYGALDMAGNALEWVADWHDRDYYSESPAENPQGPDYGIHRVLRGGSFETDVSSLRSAVRFWDDPPYGNRVTGFCVVVAQATSEL